MYPRTGSGSAPTSESGGSGRTRLGTTGRSWYRTTTGEECGEVGGTERTLKGLGKGGSPGNVHDTTQRETTFREGVQTRKKRKSVDEV